MYTEKTSLSLRSSTWFVSKLHKHYYALKLSYFYQDLEIFKFSERFYEPQKKLQDLIMEFQDP